ncbi:MAG: hypothetical protein OXC11_03490, partial [Rhodospirillales bacterium]|nr:hypothetical protein [Rhodospirillales bacterium]
PWRQRLAGRTEVAGAAASSWLRGHRADDADPAGRPERERLLSFPGLPQPPGRVVVATGRLFNMIAHRQTAYQSSGTS